MLTQPFVGTVLAAVADYDDFAIATEDYRGFIDDGKGNDRIGPVDGNGQKSRSSQGVTGM